MIELLTCPFCNIAPREHNQGQEWFLIECMTGDCIEVRSAARTRDEAATLWNRRSHAALAAEVERLTADKNGWRIEYINAQKRLADLSRAVRPALEAHEYRAKYNPPERPEQLVAVNMTWIELCSIAAIRALAKPAAAAAEHTPIPKPRDRDWPEDFGHENGNYICLCHRCDQQFFGYKRRVVCKRCATQPAAPAEETDCIGCLSDWPIVPFPSTCSVHQIPEEVHFIECRRDAATAAPAEETKK